MKNKQLLWLTLATGLATANTDTMIVFDASGSMWGQIEGQTKIEIARKAMDDISQGFAPNQVVGLMAYGHRRKGDCGDIEVLVEPVAGAASQISQRVSGIQPKGKTPLSQAVKVAAEQLKFTENKAEVVLITDGVETCDMDPCGVAAELENLGVDFTAHVIGFGLSADQGKQVSCMADITGGQYVPAANASALNEALQQVIAAEDPAPVVSLPEATIQAPEETVAIGAGFTVNWTGPAADADYIALVPAGNQRTYGELSYAWTADGNPSTLRAPGKVGTYDLHYIWQGPGKKHILATTSLTVVDSEVSLIAPAQVAAGEYFEVQWQGPNRSGDYVDLVKKGHQRAYGELSYFYTKDSPDQGDIEAPAAAGEYDLRYILEAPGGRQILHRVPIRVAPVEVTLAFEPQAELAQTITVYWTGPNNKKGYVDIVKVGDKRTYGEISYFYLKDAPDSGELMAPVAPGDYDIRFVMDGAGGRKVVASQPITIVPVAVTLAAPDRVPAGSSIPVSWQGPNRAGDYVDLVPVNKTATYGELSYFYTNGNPEQGILTAPEQAGEYKIRYVIQGRQRAVLKEHVITVE